MSEPMTNEESWGCALKPNDEVAAWIGGGWSSNVEIRRVSRTTNTQIIVGMKRFNRRTLREVGRQYGCRIGPVTEEVRHEIDDRNRRSAALGVLADIHWRSETTAVLEAMAQAYHKARGIDESPAPPQDVT